MNNEEIMRNGNNEVGIPEEAKGMEERSEEPGRVKRLANSFFNYLSKTCEAINKTCETINMFADVVVSVKLIATAPTDIRTSRNCAKKAALDTHSSMLKSKRRNEKERIHTKKYQEKYRKRR